MKTIALFEAEARKNTFQSHDELRRWLKQHPLLSEYATDLLIERGALRVLGSGLIVSAAAVAKDGEEKSAEWRSSWPALRPLMDVLFEPIKFREMQAELKAREQSASHWLCVHALGWLTKRNWVRKDGDLYALTDAGKAERKRLTLEEDTEFDRLIIEAAKKVTRDGKVRGADVLAELGSTYDENESGRIEDWLCPYIEDGRLPGVELIWPATKAAAVEID